MIATALVVGVAIIVLLLVAAPRPGGGAQPLSGPRRRPPRKTRPMR